MPRVVFTPNLRRHVGNLDGTAPGCTVREVLDAIFAERPTARGYVLDEQNAVRKHITILIAGERIKDRERLSDSVRENAVIYVLQSLSGG